MSLKTYLRSQKYIARQQQYQAYLASPHWQEVREKELARAKYLCEICHQLGHLEVHHKSYVNLWDEQPGDLQVVCADCHRKLHPEKASFVELEQRLKSHFRS